MLLKHSCNGYHRVNCSWSCSPITCLFVQYKPYFSPFLMKDASRRVWSALSPRGILFRTHLWWRGLLSELVSSKLPWLLSTTRPRIIAICDSHPSPVVQGLATGHPVLQPQNCYRWTKGERKSGKRGGVLCRGPWDNQRGRNLWYLTLKDLHFQL